MSNVYNFIFPQYSFNWFVRCGFNYPFLCLIMLFGVFAYGACLGSFLNVCIWRMPRGESVINVPSHCTICGHPIKWYDNIPIISYLILRGKCRFCKTPYSIRYFIIELICGLLFCGITLKCGYRQQPPATIITECVFILYVVGASLIDAKYKIIPDLLSIPTFIVIIALAWLFPNNYAVSHGWQSLLIAIGSGAVAAILPALLALLGDMIHKPLFGWGDVKFICVCGAAIGLVGALWTLFAGSWIGVIIGLTRLLCAPKNKRRRFASIAFGPCLGLAAVLWIFLGNHIFLIIKNILLLQS